MTAGDATEGIYPPVHHHGRVQVTYREGFVHAGPVTYDLTSDAVAVLRSAFHGEEITQHWLESGWADPIIAVIQLGLVKEASLPGPIHLTARGGAVLTALGLIP